MKTLAFGIFLSFALLAQAPPPAISGVIQELVPPVPCGAVTVEITAETISRGLDGPPVTQTGQAKMYRDGKGRVRMEMDDIGVVVLLDPVAGFGAFLTPSANLALRGPFNKTAEGYPSDQLTNARNSAKPKPEDLGRRTIDGIAFQGSRVRTPNPARASQLVTMEYWTSTDQVLTAELICSYPEGGTKARITSINRAEP